MLKLTVKGAEMVTVAGFIVPSMVTVAPLGSSALAMDGKPARAKVKTKMRDKNLLRINTPPFLVVFVRLRESIKTPPFPFKFFYFISLNK
jgi:hypothetical protein